MTRALWTGLVGVLLVTASVSLAALAPDPGWRGDLRRPIPDVKVDYPEGETVRLDVDFGVHSYP